MKRTVVRKNRMGMFHVIVFNVPLQRVWGFQHTSQTTEMITSRLGEEPKCFNSCFFLFFFLYLVCFRIWFPSEGVGSVPARSPAGNVYSET